MSSSSVRSIGMLGLVGLVGLMIMMLMSLGSMTDAGAVGLSKEVHKSLARSLAEDVKTTRVSMRHEGGKIDGPRHYTVSLQPSAAVATDDRACNLLLARAAEFVGTRVGGKKTDEVAITCVAVRPGSTDLSREFVRTSTEEGIGVSPRETATASPPPAPETAPGKTPTVPGKAPKDASPAPKSPAAPAGKQPSEQKRPAQQPAPRKAGERDAR